jgi:hypothetical protein
MVIRRITALTLGLATAAVCVSSAGGREPYASFYTPGKAAYCSSVVDITGDNAGYVPWLYCWTPNDGFTIELRDVNRRPSARYVAKNKRHHESSTRRLTYRQEWWLNRAGREGTGTAGQGNVLIRCASRTTGLTCTNRRGHGFWLGRYRGYRLF